MHDDHVPVKNAGPDLLSEMKFEHRDIALQKLMGFIVVFIVGFIAAMIVTIGIYQFFIPDWAKLGKIAAPSPYRRLPPHPQIQVDPKHDMELYRLAEDKQVSGEQGAIPGTKPAMTVTAAIDKLAGQEGIAGITGTTEAKRGEFFPGSRAFAGKTEGVYHGTGGPATQPEGASAPATGGEHGASSGGAGH
jgi:hypothetical protein